MGNFKKRPNVQEYVSSKSAQARVTNTHAFRWLLTNNKYEWYATINIKLKYCWSAGSQMNVFSDKSSAHVSSWSARKNKFWICRASAECLRFLHNRFKKCTFGRLEFGGFLSKTGIWYFHQVSSQHLVEQTRSAQDSCEYNCRSLHVSKILRAIAKDVF